MSGKYLFTSLLSLIGSVSLSAQESEPTDSLVRLMSAQSVRMVQKEYENYREVIGPARFLHNDTYLLCDTAHWNVDTKIILARGNVQIIQEGTILTSDNLEYVTDLNVARFRGSVVQLTDKDNNTLRTAYLDYNTKDSVAVFRFGGAMKDKDGQVIESDEGTYDSKIKTFTFERNVNMYADSIFIKSSRIVYDAGLDKAFFDEGVDAWKEENMLSSRKGWYDKGRELLFFHDEAHIMTSRQEGWSDSLYYYRNDGQVEMRGNAQVTDTVKRVSAVGQKIVYTDSLARVTLSDQAAMIAEISEKKDSVQRVDTVYVGADRINLFSRKMFELAASDTAVAYGRVRGMSVDPVEQYRAKCAKEAAEAAEKAREEKLKRDGMTEQAMSNMSKLKEAPTAPEEKTDVKDLPDTTLSVAVDSTLAAAVADSTLAVKDTTLSIPADSTLAVKDTTLSVAVDSTLAAAVTDSLAAQKQDTTEVRFVKAFGNVRVFKKDMQARCDSLEYCDLDSLARLYLSPVIWNEGRRQYVADSIYVSVKGSTLDKANLMSNAFITVLEDSLHFDQIKSTEMMAYFDTTAALKRFDALGEASALFFMKENNEITTVNKVQTRILSANFVSGDIDRIYYYDSPKNDAYPVVQLPREEREMKGFSWLPEKRPASRMDITTCVLRDSQRGEYSSRPKTSYKQTDRFFPGYMQSVFDGIEESRRRRAERQRDSLEVENPSVQDSLKIKEMLDSGADSTAVADTVSAIQVAADSTKAETQLSEKESRALERQRKREARFAELDRRDAERAAAKKARAMEKQRRKALKFLRKEERRKAREEAAIQRYMRKYEAKLARKKPIDSIQDGNEEEIHDPSTQLSPRIEARGKVQSAPQSGK